MTAAIKWEFINFRLKYEVTKWISNENLRRKFVKKYYLVVPGNMLQIYDLKNSE